MSEEEIRVEQETEKVPVPTTLPARIRRRRRLRYAAPLGFLVLLFALIGVISVLVTTIGWIVAAQDDTALREELYAFLDPVMVTQYRPSVFDNAETAADSDTLLLAAVYRVSETERIRQLREKDKDCVYRFENEQSRMIVPQSVIEESYRHLFGDVKIAHRTIDIVEYKADAQCYYVPTDMSILTSGYTPVLGKIRHKKDTYTVQVAYVYKENIQYDERGRALEPTVEMAQFSQWYTVRKDKNGKWTLLSIANE